MKKTICTSTLAFAAALGWTLPAQAADRDDELMRELAAMRAQMAQMAERIDTLEDQLADAKAKAETAQQVADGAAAAAAKAPPVEVAWKGAPELKGPGGWSFKPRGRLQVDGGHVDAPAGVASSDRLGTATEVRRLYFGFDGTIPGGFGYRVEADLANSDVTLTDVYLTYKASKQVTLTLGQHKPFWSLEETTSDLFTSMMERAAFHSAFGFERRLGASATYADDLFVVQGGVFSDDLDALNDDRNGTWSVDGRIVAMPKLAGGTLHLGLSGHLRDLKGTLQTGRYRTRPFLHTTDLRLVDTGSFAATGERSLGAELAYVSGPFHATAESHWLKVRRPGLPGPTFNGGYAEVGYLLTGEDTAYKNGGYDRIRPKRPVGAGGFGAVQVNARYDWLDLNDAGIVGGRQQVAGVSVIWIPSDYVRLMANYGRIRLRDAAVTAAGDANYSADAFGMRAQVDF